jgi:hypothetical protein
VVVRLYLLRTLWWIWLYVIESVRVIELRSLTTGRRMCRTRCTPLRSRRSRHCRWLICLWMKLLRAWIRSTVLLATPEEIKTSLDVNIGWIQFSCPLVGIQSIGSLVVARLILIMLVVLMKHRRNLSLPEYRDHTKPLKYWDSGGWLENKHPKHRGIGLSDSTEHQWNTRRSGFFHHDRLLVDKLHRHWDTCSVPYNSDQGGTSFEHRFDLITISNKLGD